MIPFCIFRGDCEESSGLSSPAECFPQSQRPYPLHQSPVVHQDHVDLECPQLLPPGVDPAAHLAVRGDRAPEANPGAEALLPDAGGPGVRAALRAPWDPAEGAAPDPGQPGVAVYPCGPAEHPQDCRWRPALHWHFPGLGAPGSPAGPAAEARQDPEEVRCLPGASGGEGGWAGVSVRQAWSVLQPHQHQRNREKWGVSVPAAVKLRDSTLGIHGFTEQAASLFSVTCLLLPTISWEG